MNTVSNNASAIATILKSRNQVQTTARQAFTESTFELDLTHPDFNREDFVLDADDYVFRMAGRDIMFGSLEAWTNDNVAIYDIFSGMEDAMTRQLQAVTALKKVIETPENYVIGLHKKGSGWVVSRSYQGGITALTPNAEAASALFAQLEKLPADPVGEIFYPVHMLPGLAGGPSVMRVSNKPLFTKAERYTHFAIDQLLSGNMIHFNWKPELDQNKWLAVVLGSIQAIVDGDEDLQAIYRQNYDNAVTQKQVNYAAYKDVKARQEAGEVIVSSEITAMDGEGNEINLVTFGKAVLSFRDQHGRVRASLVFDPANPVSCRTAEKYLERGYTVTKTADVQ